MRILIDEQPSDIQASSIGEAINTAAAEAEGRGRVIVEVVVDGEPWNEEQLASAELCAGRAQELRLVSADLIDLVQQTLADASEILAGADELQRAAAELLQADRRAEAMDKLAEALVVWRAVQTAVFKSSQALQLDLDNVRVGESTMSQSVTRLNEQLVTLRSALEANDPVALSDALLYEMPHVVAEWREALLAIQTHVRERTSPS